MERQEQRLPHGAAAPQPPHGATAPQPPHGATAPQPPHGATAPQPGPTSGLVPAERVPRFDNGHRLAARFRAHVQARDFPCVGAKSALARQQMDFIVGRDIRSAWDDLRILPALAEIATRYRADRSIFRSLVLLFEGPRTLDEQEYEVNLWDRLQSLSDKDDWLGFQPDPAVSSDPDDPHFSLSFAGEGFFVVGLHPSSSRPARRFAVPAMVFNLHDQFETLRREGRYERLRQAILDRDRTLSGSINPMLARHGTASAARQYSGRIVPEDWECPFVRAGADD